MDLYSLQCNLQHGNGIFDVHLRCTFYARVSTEKEEQQNSLMNQIEYFTDYIQHQNNWSYVEGYIDDGISGASVEKRSSFLQMIQDAQDGKFDLILTKEISRFARNTVDSIQYTRELLKSGVGVYFLNDQINTFLPDAELRLTIMSSIAQEEIRKLSERIRFGHQRSIKKGIVLGNSQLWGYEKKEGKLFIDYREAQMIKLIFQFYIDGIGFRTISKKLYKMGYTTKNGKQLSYSTLKYIITNPKYRGVYAGGKTITVDYRTKEKKHLNKNEWTIIENCEYIPAIVDKEVWFKANEILEKKNQKYSSKNDPVYHKKFTYSGILYCDLDGNRYWHTSIGKNKTEMWQCSNYRKEGKRGCNSSSISKNKLDKILIDIIFSCITDFQGWAEELIEFYKNIIVNSDESALEIKKIIENLRSKMDMLLNLEINDDIINKGLKEKINYLDQKLSKYLKMELLFENSDKNKQSESINQIENFIKRVAKNEIDDFDELIKIFTEKIIVKDKSLYVYLKNGLEKEIYI